MTRLVWGVTGLILLLPGRAAAQLRLMEAEFDASAGYSIVNATAWVAPGQLTSSSKLAYGGDARVFVAQLGRIKLGLEAGHHNFWSFRAIYTPNLVLGDVNADQVSAVLRLPLGRFNVDVGGGAQIFDEFTDAALHGAVRYAVPLKPQVSMPIGLRADVIFDGHTILAPLLVTIGFSLQP